MKRQNPSTSIEAYKALTPEKLKGDYKKILEALKVLGSGTYEQISDFLNCREPNVISRRMKELEGMQLVWKPGGKKLTKRGRNAFVYQLTSDSSPKTESVEKALKADGKDLAQISRNISKVDSKPSEQYISLFPDYMANLGR